MFHGIYFCFIPYLKDFVLVFKFFIKLVRILHMVEFSNLLKLFSNLFLKALTHFKGGWMGDHALYALLKILLNICMKWVVGSMSYTLDSHCIFNWYHNWYFYVCILISVFSIYICFKFQIVSILIGIYIFIHIYDLIVLTTSLHLKAQIIFMLSLI